MDCSSHLLQHGRAGNLVGWRAGLQAVSRAEVSVEERQVVLVVWSVFISCWSAPLDKNVRIPAELCTNYHSLPYILYFHNLLCHFFSFFSPILPLLLSFPPSCCYAWLSFSVCSLDFLAPMQFACHSWDVYLSFSLFLSFFLLISGCLSGWLRVCFYFSLSLYISLSASSSHSPPLSVCSESAWA